MSHKTIPKIKNKTDQLDLFVVEVPLEIYSKFWIEQILKIWTQAQDFPRHWWYMLPLDLTVKITYTLFQITWVKNFVNLKD